MKMLVVGAMGMLALQVLLVLGYLDIPYLAPVHDCLVADDAVIADYRWVTGVGVQHAAVLDVGPGSDTDGLRIAAQHGPVPDARLFTQVDVPDNAGSRRDPGRTCDLREGVAVGKHIAALIQIQRGVLVL
jgi:hypothetical protein